MAVLVFNQHEKIKKLKGDGIYSTNPPNQWESFFILAQVAARCY